MNTDSIAFFVVISACWRPGDRASLTRSRGPGLESYPDCCRMDSALYKKVHKISAANEFGLIWELCCFCNNRVFCRTQKQTTNRETVEMEFIDNVELACSEGGLCRHWRIVEKELSAEWWNWHKTRDSLWARVFLQSAVYHAELLKVKAAELRPEYLNWHWLIQCTAGE